MSTLIFQIQLKQWDKSERTPVHISARAALPNKFNILSKPEFLILECECIIDHHGESDAEKNRKLKTALMKDGSVLLERFLIKKEAGLVSLSYQNEQGHIESIGDLNSGWIQISYTWRKRVNENKQIFWLYEELTLNAAFVESVENDYFLTNKPQKIINIDD
ncbi:MAG: hypothetical protein HRU38_05280 [Saccharospirillaceae bacterium]|nr:hypothetical protein [Pseudomonadales bacterium]NRB78070.1 hypothetical protein [Saccharospirillaceae bacterium]